MQSHQGKKSRYRNFQFAIIHVLLRILASLFRRETQMFLIKFSGSFDFLKTLLGANRRAVSEDVLASVHGI